MKTYVSNRLKQITKIGKAKISPLTGTSWPEIMKLNVTS